jgi:hypothetical protein
MEKRPDRRLPGPVQERVSRLGLGQYFLHQRNVKGFCWNHKRVYRSYRELELNLRIKPRKRLLRERQEPLRPCHRRAAPAANSQRVDHSSPNRLGPKGDGRN